MEEYYRGSASVAKIFKYPSIFDANMIVISKQFHSTSLHHGHSGLLAAIRYHHLLGRNLQIVFLIIITCSNLSSVQATAPSPPPHAYCLLSQLSEWKSMTLIASARIYPPVQRRLLSSPGVWIKVRIADSEPSRGRVLFKGVNEILRNAIFRESASECFHICKSFKTVFMNMV